MQSVAAAVLDGTIEKVEFVVPLAARECGGGEERGWGAGSAAKRDCLLQSLNR